MTHDPFNMYTVFFGKEIEILQLLEIMFRTSFMYFYTILNVRLMDKRSLGQLSSFDVIIIIALGTSVGDPMFYHVPLLQAMVVISTIVFMERIVAKLIETVPFFEMLISGKPVLLIKHGKVLEKNIKKENITLEELNSILRLKGVKNTGEVSYAYLEPSGNISVLRLDKPVEGLSTINQNIE